MASSFLGLFAAVGCEDSKPSVASSATEATVKGTVTIDGKPITAGEITFDPSNFQRQTPIRTSPIGKDGSYEIKTLVGENIIRLTGVALKKSPIVQSLKRALDVKAGENTYNFEGSAK